MATVLITGASRGIGQALAVKVAKLGHQVMAVGREKKALEETQKKNPHHIQMVTADVAKSEDRERIVQAMLTKTKPFYVVHSAGIMAPIAMIGDVSLTAWQQHIATNLEAPFFLTQSLLPHLDGGRVLHLSTGLAHHPLAGMSTYCLSKSALFMLYECLRLELKNRDIAFGSINPGPVDTAMQDKIRHSKSTALPEVKRFIDMKDQGQLLPPTVVADFMSWLLFEVDKEKFSQNEWDIRDSSHHHFWLKDKNIIWGARI